MATTINPHSSFIEEAKYEEKTKTLRLKIGGAFYYYMGVTKQKFGRFRNAVSRGTYYSQFIKGKYKTIKRRVRK